MGHRFRISLWRALYFCFFLLFAPLLALGSKIDESVLENAISNQRNEIEEFNEVAKEAKRRGLRVYLLGGSASSLGDFIKEKELRPTTRNGSNPRFKFELNNILLPEQDIDLVVAGSNGRLESAAEIQDFRNWVRGRYPYTTDGKSRWDVLGLNTPDTANYKMALKGNPDFLNQNNDSLSLGMIELTRPEGGEGVITDLGKNKLFLKDLADEEFHFLRSPLHHQTAYAQSGRNPPILSAVRAIEKAVRYNKRIDAAGADEIKNIIAAWDPYSVQPGSYVYNYLMGRGKRVVTHANNLEMAFGLLNLTGLRDKLLEIPGNDPNTVESLAWWLHKKPLPSSLPGSGTGQTAGSLGIKTATHKTGDSGHRLITWNFDGTPRLFESRDGFPGENAAIGDGFYTWPNGTAGYRASNGSSQVVTFKVDPKAKEGVDFILSPDNVLIWKTTKALKVEPAPAYYPDNFTCSGLYTNFTHTTQRYIAPGAQSRASLSNYTPAPTMYNHHQPFNTQFGTPPHSPGTIHHKMFSVGRARLSSVDDALDEILSETASYASSPGHIIGKAHLDFMALQITHRASPVNAEGLAAIYYKSDLSSYASGPLRSKLTNFFKSDLQLMARVDKSARILESIGQKYFADRIRAEPHSIFSDAAQNLLQSKRAKYISWRDTLPPLAQTALQDKKLGGIILGGAAFWGLHEIGKREIEKEKAAQQQFNFPSSSPTPTPSLTPASNPRGSK